MRYKVTKNLAGAFTVKFACPKCGLKLSDALKRAGQPDACPECGEQFQIPGAKELAELQARAQQQAEEKAAQKAAKVAQREQEARAKQLRQQEEAEAKQRLAREAEANPPVAFMPPAEPPSQSHTSSRTRYPALYLYQTALKVLGYAVLLAGATVFAYAIYLTMSSGDDSVAIFSAGLTTFIGLLGTGFVLLAASELIRVFLDIEQHTRVTAENSDR